MQHAAHKEGGEEREAKGRCAQGMPGDRGPTTAAAEGGAGVVATPGTVSYNAAITACARGMRTEEALSLFREMGDRGVPRDEVRMLLVLSEVSTTHLVHICMDRAHHLRQCL